MFKIEIRSDDGQEVQISRGNFLYYKEANGNEHYCDWTHLAGRDQDFDEIFEAARTILRTIESFLPDLPPSAIR